MNFLFCVGPESVIPRPLPCHLLLSRLTYPMEHQSWVIQKTKICGLNK